MTILCHSIYAGGLLMGKYVEITESNFNEDVLGSDIPVVVDFWAEWCAPCKLLSPIIDELADEYNGKVKFGKLNVDQNQQISIKYGIRSIPTLIVFKNGEAAEQMVGFLPKQSIIDKINPFL
jgi:thioredoxin 1